MSKNNIYSDLESVFSEWPKSEKLRKILESYDIRSYEELYKIIPTRKTNLENNKNIFLNYFRSENGKKFIDLEDDHKELLESSIRFLEDFSVRNRLIFIKDLSNLRVGDINFNTNQFNELISAMVGRKNYSPKLDFFLDAKLVNKRTLEDYHVSNFKNINLSDIKYKQEYGHSISWITLGVIKGEIAINEEAESTLKVNCPVFMIPITISKQQSKKIYSMHISLEREITLNPFISQYFSDNLKSDNIDEILQLVLKDEISKAFRHLESFINLKDFDNLELNGKKHTIGIYPSTLSPINIALKSMIREQKLPIKLYNHLSFNNQKTFEENSELLRQISNDYLKEDVYSINSLNNNQLKALKISDRNFSLNIQGPPGTGKSHLISSIISNSILKNKKVLVMSEKITALDVIYKNLLNFNNNFPVLKITNLDRRDTEFSSQLKKFLTNINYSENEVADFDILEKKDKTLAGLVTDNLSSIQKFNNEMNVDVGGSKSWNVIQKFAVLASKKGVTNIDTLEDLKLRNIEYDEIPVFIDTIFSIRKKFTFKEAKLYLNLKPRELESLINNHLNIKEYILNFKEISKIPFYSLLKRRSAIKGINGSSFKEIKILYKIRNFIERESLLITSFLKKIKLHRFDFENLKKYIDKKNIDLIYDVFDKEDLELLILKKILHDKDIIEYLDKDSGNFYAKEIFSQYKHNTRSKLQNTKNLITALSEKYSRTIFDLNRDTYAKKFKSSLDEMKKTPNFIFKNFSPILRQVTPVILSTPNSVADALLRNNYEFDTLIIDEGSQIYFEKLLPGFSLAKQVIIVGDDKQLQPSNFFKKQFESDIDEFEESYIKYKNAIAYADASSYISIMLQSHYRSSFSNLIKFSNKYFYDNKLEFTDVKNSPFPASSSIEYVELEDSFRHDKQLITIKEARAIIDKIRDLLRSDVTKNMSIGIVAFNSKQESLIVNELQNESNLYDELIEGNNLFVKSLENVQGDERDIIIISGTFARKKDLSFSQSQFSVLNRNGGENRINVLITRAKYMNIIISSISPSLIKESDAIGRSIWKKYLIFAKNIEENKESKNKTFDENKLIKSPPLDDDFKNDVLLNLRNWLSSGYIVESNVDDSMHLMDFIIYKRGKAVLAIEVDGFRNHNSKSARLNDIQRTEFLESRGWVIYRIRSTNWLNKEDIKIDILKQLDSININSIN